MKTDIVSTDFRGILKDVTLNKENSFKIGEVLKGKIMGFSDGKPIISLKGEIFSATSKVPLKLNQNINVYVQKKEGNTTFLKIVDPEGKDSESKNINNLLKNNIEISKLPMLEKLISENLNTENALLYLKKGFKISPSLIDLFNTLNQLKDVKNISDLYKKILNFVPENKKEEFINKFLPDLSDKKSISDFLKNSLLSFESKFISENKQNFPDIKEFIAKTPNGDSSSIQKFIDINNILSYDDKKTVFIQIPWGYNDKEKTFKHSELSFKSNNLKKKDEVVNIFFILDMSNINLLKISSSYYIKGKNLDITFQTENEDLLNFIESMKNELKEIIEKNGLNVWIKTLKSDINKPNKINKVNINNSGGIDIKV
ncbi:MAG: hypothetical protein M0R46_07580 [Candidatus Muirbacterium halophilum]|nr:hypothetical protein [Candidatus Muirbacterium halophilum]MCK9475761.1 hypothetical protein [Candidatus Muirbacterium halophilum]